ncbi:MAG: hypothetical protein Q4G69_06730 [Planctomycetia bacterium]|nr:hypothetical protein [Planctomycetia bacterium]
MSEDKTDIVLNEKENKEEIREIDPPNKLLSAILGWLVPGLGHIYQGRYFKGFLFAFCIIPLLLVGIWMGSYREILPTNEERLQLGRDVWFSWREGDKRLFFIPQAMIGSVAIPALIQARYVEKNGEGFCSNLFAPPRLPREIRSSQPLLDEIILKTWSWFDLGTLFTAAAGLLNLLVIFDIIGGPSWIIQKEE